MKKRMLIALVVALVLSTTVSMAWADGPVEYTNNIVKEDHKVKNKWDLSGTFVAYPGYNWGGLAEGATWTYGIHIKEAVNEQASVGSIHFMTDDIDVAGHVDATSRVTYWGYLGAVGTAQYNDATYYFMFLYNSSSMWFALSETPYDGYWPGTIWGWGLRNFQLHSLNLTGQFPLDHHAIH